MHFKIVSIAPNSMSLTHLHCQSFPQFAKTGEKSETNRITQANFSVKKKKLTIFYLQGKVVNVQHFTSTE